MRAYPRSIRSCNACCRLLPNRRSIRRGNYKLIEFFEDDHIELYDLAADIGETVNLVSAYPDLAAELLNDLRRWRRSVGARMPTPNPQYDPARAHMTTEPGWLLRSQPVQRDR